MSLELNYKASNILKAERSEKRKFFGALQGMQGGDLGVEDIVFLTAAGGASEDVTLDALDTIGMAGVMEEVAEALGTAGFLQGADAAVAKAEAPAKK